MVPPDTQLGVTRQQLETTDGEGRPWDLLVTFRH